MADIKNDPVLKNLAEEHQKHFKKLTVMLEDITKVSKISHCEIRKSEGAIRLYYCFELDEKYNIFDIHKLLEDNPRIKNLYTGSKNIFINWIDITEEQQTDINSLNSVVTALNKSIIQRELKIKFDCEF